MTYDSEKDTREHIRHVDHFMKEIFFKLLDRKEKHDASKLEQPEKETYDTLVPRLKLLKYGSPEYEALLKEMKPALAHHFANNRHHPEHFENGIDDMTLVDVVEMFCDWMAASIRSDTGFSKGLEVNKKRFNMSDQLYRIFANTAKELGWYE